MTKTELRSLATSRQSTNLPIALAALHAAFLIGSLVAVPVLAPGARIPNPFGPDDLSRSFFLNHPEAVRVSAFLQLASAICLAGLSAALSGAQRMERGRSTASALTLVGGGGAAILLALTAICSWALASPGAVDPGPAFRVLQFLPFPCGGPGWAGFFALFLAGVAMGGPKTAPRWALLFGYFLSVLSTLATAVLLTINAAPCLPLARFLGVLWLLLISIYAAKESTGALAYAHPPHAQ